MYFFQVNGINLKYYQENGEWAIEEIQNDRAVFTDRGFRYSKVKDD